MSASRTDARAGRAALVFVALAVLVGLLWESSPRQISDIGLYREYATNMVNGLVPYRDFGVEYPPGALLAFIVPAVLGTGTLVYGVVFVLLFAALGGVAVVLIDVLLRLLDRSSKERTHVLVFLALLPIALGSVLVSRFDTFPALLVLLSLLAVLRGRSPLGGALLGAAIAVKLYPAVVVPVVVAFVWRHRGPREALRTGALTVLVPVLAYLPFAVLSPDGVGRSLARQATRPLQIESLGASVLLALHHAVGLDVEWKSSRGSQNLVGMLPSAVAAISSVAVLATIVAITWWFVRGGCRQADLPAAAAACVLAFVCLGKVFSPQFLIWVAFLVPLAGGVRGRSAWNLTLVACAATLVYFPARYWDLVKEFDPLGSWVLLLRNLLLVAALVLLALPLREQARESVPLRSRSPGLSPGRT